MSSLACELEGIWDGAMNWSAQFSDSQHSLRHRRHCTLALVFTAAGMHGWWGCILWPRVPPLLYCCRSGGSAQLSSSIDHLRDRVKDGSSACAQQEIAFVYVRSPLRNHCRGIPYPGTSTDSGYSAAACCTSTVHILEKQGVLICSTSVGWCKSNQSLSYRLTVLLSLRPQNWVLARIWPTFELAPAVCLWFFLARWWNEICKYLAWHGTLSQHQV